MSASLSRLTGSRILARNSALNLLGVGLPMAVALVTVPVLIRALGEERFGILTVGWVVIGYFSLFDFGLGRALTKLLAEKLSGEDEEEIPPLVWTTLLLMFLLGVAGALLLAVLAPWLVRDVLKMSPELRLEALPSFYLLAFSLPWVISTTGLLGVLEANQSFGVVTSLRLPLGLFTYVSPLAVLPFTTSLVPVIALLVVGRLIAWVAHLVACLRVLPVLRSGIVLEWSRVKSLARFGGWLTVSNVISPLMTHLDRFLIGALISVTAVAYYVTPYELVAKLWLIPGALMGVLFPAFAATFAHDRTRTNLLFDRGVRVTFLAVFPIALVLITLAHEGMDLWLGAEFASKSAGVLRWLALGVFINCLAQVPFALIQGVGRPDITGKLHLLEFPFYCLVIWFLSRSYGIEGVALAWVLRVTLDTSILFVVAQRLLGVGVAPLRRTAQMVLAALALFAVAAVQEGLVAKVAFLVGALVVFLLVAWWRILAPGERAFFQRRYVAGPS